MTNEEYILRDGEKYVVTRIFDNKKYVKVQSKKIRERIKMFDSFIFIISNTNVIFNSI